MHALFAEESDSFCLHYFWSAERKKLVRAMSDNLSSDRSSNVEGGFGKGPLEIKLDQRNIVQVSQTNFLSPSIDSI